MKMTVGSGQWAVGSLDLLTIHCPLPTAHCPLPTVHCPLSAIFVGDSMTGNTTILIAVILFSIVLIAWLVLRPSVTATRGGKMLAFVGLLVFPVLAGGMGVNQHIER